MNDKLSLNISNIDFSKIARNAADARNGRFLKESQIQKKYWEENNGLSYVKRNDGTALIFDGNTPMGFTPISALETWTGNNNLSNNNSSNNNLSSSNLSKIIRKSIDESNKNAQNNVTTNSNVQSSSNIQTSSISNLVSTPEKTESSSTINTDNTTKSTNTSSTAKPQISNVSKVVATNLTSSVKTDTSNKSISKKTSIIGKFKVKNGKTYFINSKGKKVTGIKEINGKIYYFDKKGVMKTNCLHKNKDGTYKYFGKKGYAVSGFRKLNGRIYYFSPTTKNSVKGKQKINNKIYYFNAKGVMQTGWIQWKKSKKWSYFKSNGTLAFGSVKISGKTYNFGKKGVINKLQTSVKQSLKNFEKNNKIIVIGDSRTQQLKTQSKSLKVRNNISFISQNAAKVSWYLTEGVSKLEKVLKANKNKKYHIIVNMGVNDIISGSVTSKANKYINSLKKLAKKYKNVKFYFMSVNPVDNLKNARYHRSNKKISQLNNLINKSIKDFQLDNLSYIDSSKSLKYQTYDGLHYKKSTNKKIVDFISKYIYIKNRKKYSTVQSNGKLYLINQDSKKVKNTLYKWKDGTYSYFGKNGSAISGFKTINGKKYYFSPITGKSITGKQIINNKLYYFNKNGVMQTGLVKWKDGKYKDRYTYFNKKGEAVTGFKKINGKTYYFNSKTYASIKGKHEINNRIYYFNKNGEMVTGWVQWKKNKKWSYFGKSGIMYTGKAKVDGHIYNFGKKGLVKKVTNWVKNGDKYVFYYKNGTKKTFDKSCYESWKRIQNMDSDTKYLLALDAKKARLDVFKGSKGKWEPYITKKTNGDDKKYSWYIHMGRKVPTSKSYLIPKGFGNKYEYLTPRGKWKIERTRWVGSNHMYGVRFSAKKTVDCIKGHWKKPSGLQNRRVYIHKWTGALGHNGRGCLGLSVERVRWIHHNCKAGTTLYVW